MSERWDDLDAELAVEGRLNGWRVYRAREARWVAPIGHLDRQVEVPPGWYWAAHRHPDEPPVVAAALVELERLVGERTPPEQPAMCDVPDAIDAESDAVPHEHIEKRLWELLADPPERSVMRELLSPDDSRRLEQSPGRFFLPGPPP